MDAAWKFACANHFTATTAASSDLLKEVRALQPGDALHFLRSAHVSKGRRRQIGAAGDGVDKEMEELAQEALNLSMLEQPWNGEGRDRSMLDDSYCEESHENLPPPQVAIQSNAPVITRPMPSIQPEMLTSDPSSIDKCRMVLVVDAREHSGAGRAKRNPTKGKPITEHLQKLEVEYELRALSVGDYLWVLKLGDGRGEMVLDYIVERKTWSDLKVINNTSDLVICSSKSPRVLVKHSRHKIYRAEAPITREWHTQCDISRRGASNKEPLTGAGTRHQQHRSAFPHPQNSQSRSNGEVSQDSRRSSG